eukprot:6190419-Pleurochrysis_carterae.AAC.1
MACASMLPSWLGIISAAKECAVHLRVIVLSQRTSRKGQALSQAIRVDRRARPPALVHAVPG